MEVIPVGTGKFTLDKYKLFRNPLRVLLLEVQIKDDGCINDTPAFLCIMKDERTNVYYTEFSFETLQAIFSKMGYQIVRKKNK
jgi:hypothetical protein